MKNLIKIVTVATSLLLVGEVFARGRAMVKPPADVPRADVRGVMEARDFKGLQKLTQVNAELKPIVKFVENISQASWSGASLLLQAKARTVLKGLASRAYRAATQWNSGQLGNFVLAAKQANSVVKKGPEAMLKTFTSILSKKTGVPVAEVREGLRRDCKQPGLRLSL